MAELKIISMDEVAVEEVEWLWYPYIERKNESYENMNVDLSRTPMNVSFKGCGELTYNEYLDQMIAAETVSLKGLKPDAKVFDEMIMSRFLHPKINPKSVGNAQKIEIMKGRNTQ